MTLQLPEELAYAKKLMDQAKFEESLKIIENYEKTEYLSQENQLSALLLKVNIYDYINQDENIPEISERAYQISQDLGLIAESIEALIGKALIGYMGDYDKVSTYLIEAERRINFLGYYVTSAKTGKGVIEAFNAIIEKLYHKYKKLTYQI